MSSPELVANDFGPKINGVSWSLTAASTLFLGTRLYIKRTAHRGFWWDDYVLVAAWLMLVSTTSITTYATHLGEGKHFSELPENNVLPLQFIMNLATPFSIFGSAWSKTSFALTLLRLTKGHVRSVVWGIIATLNLMLFFNAIMPFIACRPTAKSWNPYLEGECWDHEMIVQYAVFAAAYSAGMDFVLAIVPWTVIMKLQMKLKEKIGVAICMSLGFIAGGTSIMRCLKTPLISSTDLSYEAGQLSIWTVAEISTTIMAASIPVLRILVRRVVAHRMHKTNPSTGYYNKSAPNGTFKNGTRITVITSGHSHTSSKASGNPDDPERGQKKPCGHKKSLSWLSTDDSDSDDDSHELRSVNSKKSSKKTGLGHKNQGSVGMIVKSETITVDYQRRSMISDNRRAAIDMIDQGPPNEPLALAQPIMARSSPGKRGGSRGG